MGQGYSEDGPGNVGMAADVGGGAGKMHLPSEETTVRVEII